MSEPTEADWKRASVLLDLAPMGGTNALLQAVAAAIAAAREEGRQEVRAAVETLAGYWETRGWPAGAADLRAAVAPAQPADGERWCLAHAQAMPCADSDWPCQPADVER